MTNAEQYVKTSIEFDKKNVRKNLQIYIANPSLFLHKINNTNLRLFLLKGMIDFLSEKDSFVDFIVESHLFNIKRYDAQKRSVVFENGEQKTVEIIPVVTSETKVLRDCSRVISAISSVNEIKRVNFNKIIVDSLVYTREDEILKCIKREKQELEESIEYLYELVFKNKKVFSSIINKDDIHYIETIEKYLGKK